MSLLLVLYTQVGINWGWIYRASPSLFFETRIQAFAAKLNFHPGLVVGSFNTQVIPFSHSRECWRKIRPILTEVALTDGLAAFFQTRTRRSHVVQRTAPEPFTAVMRKDGHMQPFTMHDLASWAYDNGLCQPQRSTIVTRLAEEFSRAMRADFHLDPQGRRVRTKHVATL